jgi:putative transposase
MPRGKGKRHSAEQIVRILREAEGARTVAHVCGEYNISEQTFYRWRKKYGAMEQSEVRKLKELEEENRRLKHLVADQALDIHLLKEINAKKW